MCCQITSWRFCLRHLTPGYCFASARTQPLQIAWLLTPAWRRCETCCAFAPVSAWTKLKRAWRCSTKINLWLWIKSWDCRTWHGMLAHLFFDLSQLRSPAKGNVLHLLVFRRQNIPSSRQFQQSLHLSIHHRRLVWMGIKVIPGRNWRSSTCSTCSLWSSGDVSGGHATQKLSSGHTHTFMCENESTGVGLALLWYDINRYISHFPLLLIVLMGQFLIDTCVLWGVV